MKKGTSFRLSEMAIRLLARLSAILGIGRAAVLEVALRDLAMKYGVEE